MVLPFVHPDIPQKFLYPISIQVNEVNRNKDRRIEDILKAQEKVTIENKIFITKSSRYFPFKDKIVELRDLKDDWDGYGGYAPNTNIIKKVERFVKKLPQGYINVLRDDGVFPNPHGTVTVEWRKNLNVVSIEFGRVKSGFYSIVNGNRESESNLDNVLSSKKLINALNSIIA